MIDEALLADPTRCPDCAHPLTPARDVCPACALRLTGPLAGQLWRVSVQASETLRIRSELLTRLRAAGAAAPVAQQPMSVPPGAPVGAPPPVGDPFAVGRPAAAPTAAPQRPAESSKVQVQNLLLALGVGLLAVAAVIFVAVSWERLGVGGRSAVMAAVTALAAVGAGWTHRRGLVSTAEWLSLLTVALGGLDCYGARSADLFGLASSPGLAYWSGATAVVALLTGLLAVGVPTRVLPVAATVLAQLPVPLLALRIGESDYTHPQAPSAALLAAQVVAVLAVAGAWPAGRRAAREVRGAALIGVLVAYPVAVCVAAFAAYTEDGSLAVGTGLLVLLAAVPAVAGTLATARGLVPDDDLVPPLDVVAAAVLVAAVWAPATELTPSRWTGPALALPALALLAATAYLPRGRRTAAAAVALAAAVVPVIAVADDLADVADRVLRPLDRPWSLAPGHTAAHLHVAALVTVVVAGLALLLAGWFLRQASLRVAAVPVLAASAGLVAPTAWMPYAGQLAAVVLLAAGLLVAGARLDARGRVPEGWAALGTGVLAVLVAAEWSLGVATATLWVLAASATALVAGVVAARGGEALRSWRVVLVTGALLLGVAEAAAVARYDGAGWPAVWSLALSLTAAVSLAVALLLSLRTTVDDAYWSPLHATAVVLSAGSAVAATVAVAAWQDLTIGGCGLAGACAVAVLLAGSAAPLPTRRPVRGAVQLTAGALGVPLLAVSAVDPDRLWLALLVVGVGTALVALTSTRHELGWLAAVLLAASSWVRLALSDVTAPEAYTAPAGVALLVAGWQSRRHDRGPPSWRAYGSGLSLALVPSLLRAVTDAGDLRPLLLAAVAAGVVGAGAWRRLQAPLLLGAGVLAVDAVVQLTPYLVAAYEVVPRWVTIGVLGLALLVSGATYEQRVRDLRRVGKHVARLG